MTFFYAINLAAKGRVIVSNVGNRIYTPEMLAPIKCGRNWAIIPSTSGMTENERRGAWTV